MKDNVRGGALTEVSFFVLLAAYEPRHGYGMMQFIEEQTGGRLCLGAGTLYGAINTLLKKGWIEPCGGEKKQYAVTAEGRRIAAAELRRLRELTAAAERIMGE